MFKSKLTKDSLYALIGQIILATSGLGLNVIIGNRYGPDGLGIFNLSLSYFLIIGLLVCFGVPESLLKFGSEVIEEQSKKIRYLNNSIFMNTTSTIFGAFLVYIFIYYFGFLFLLQNQKSAILNIFLAIPFYGLNRNLLAFLNSQREMKAFSFFNSIRWILIISITSLLISLQFEVISVVLSLVFSEIILSILLLIYNRKYLMFSFEKEVIFKLWHYGKKAILNTIMNEFSRNLSIILVGFFLGNFYTGIFSFASTAASGIFILSAAVAMNFNPIVSNLSYNDKKDELRFLMIKIRKTMIKIMFLVLLVIIIAFPIFINLFMNSDKYLNSIPIFYIMLVGVGIYSLFNWASGSLSLAGYQNENLIRTFLTLIISFILYVALIPLFGIYGSAVTFSIFYLLQLTFLEYFMRKKMKISLFTKRMEVN